MLVPRTQPPYLMGEEPKIQKDMWLVNSRAKAEI